MVPSGSGRPGPSRLITWWFFRTDGSSIRTQGGADVAKSQLSYRTHIRVAAAHPIRVAIRAILAAIVAVVFLYSVFDIHDANAGVASTFLLGDGRHGLSPIRCFPEGRGRARRYVRS